MRVQVCLLVRNPSRISRSGSTSSIMSSSEPRRCGTGNTAWRSSGTFLSASGSTRPHCLCSLDSRGLAACFSRRAQCKKPLGCSLCRVGEQHRKDMSTSEPRRRAGPPAGTLKKRSRERVVVQSRGLSALERPELPTGWGQLMGRGASRGGAQGPIQDWNRGMNRR